jgi:ribosomal protein S18 acetylase RimI-like enzyme
MQVTIRRAIPDDADTISAIWGVICAERIYTAINQPFTPQQERDYIASLSDRESIFLAEMNDQVVGFQCLDLWAKYTDSFYHVGVLGTFVLPDWRRKGIAFQLAEHTLDFARANGYEKLIIYVRAGNHGAQSFYRSLGFVAKGVLERQVKIDDQYEDEVFLELLLFPHPGSSSGRSSAA